MDDLEDSMTVSRDLTGNKSDVGSEPSDRKAPIWTAC